MNIATRQILVSLCLLLLIHEFYAFIPDHHHASSSKKANRFQTLHSSSKRHAVVVVEMKATTFRMMEKTNLDDSSLSDNNNLISILRNYSHRIRTVHTTNVKPIWALKRFIDESNTIDEAKIRVKGGVQPHDDDDDVFLETHNSNDVGDALSDTLIYSFRKCGKVGDYRMIISLLDAAMEFCHGQPILSPRVFREALDALSQTDAGSSKLNRMWKLACSEELNVLSSPIGAFELNIMLKSLGEKHQKVSAALDLYETSDIVGDCYTASTLLNLLAQSIRDNQKVSNDWIVNKAETFSSPCWQYTQGMRVLNDFVRQEGNLNNFVFSSALKLNERASEVFHQPGRRHKGAKAALSILGMMQASTILPDEITCSHVLSTFDKQHEWKAAVTMLNSMEKKKSCAEDLPTWHLPKPNVYAYSAAISACARCHEFNEAIRILQRMKKEGVETNTWVYNAALSACVSPVKKDRRQRVDMALSLINEMESGPDHSAPDTVSYNTLLATMEGMGAIFRDGKGRRICEISETEVQDGTWIHRETLVSEILQEMSSNGIPRNALTYHNAIKASKTNSQAIFQYLDEAVGEISLSPQNSTSAESSLTGRAADGLLFVFNAALSTFGKGGDIDLLAQCFELMSKANTEPNHESIFHLVLGFGRGHNSRNIMTLLKAVQGDQAASTILNEKYGLNLSYVVRQNSKELEKLYAVSISSCLGANDMDSATDVLNLMKENGVVATQPTMSEVAFAYTQLAIKAASRQSIIRRKLGKKGLTEDLRGEARIAKAHTERSSLIVRELRDPSAKLLSALSGAFAVTEDYTRARSILKALHKKVLAQQSDSMLLSRSYQEIMNIFPGLHRSLLKICASYGNATSAFSLVKDIQSFANEISSEGNELRLADAPLIADISDPLERKNINKLLFTRIHTDTARKIGMRGEDWKLLLIAASKAGDWKLCINTLQFLRPSLEATHPRWAPRKGSETLSRNYRKISRSLTALLLCLEARGQDAWAVRAIDDWIEWSGRRPPKEAVLTTIRILASEGRGEAVNALIHQVLSVDASTADRGEFAKHTYEEIIYIGGITHLHKNGLYFDADELYLEAITKKYLPFSTSTAWKDGQHKLDLHGMNVAIANSAVRTAFQQQVLQSEESIDLIIVTGRGINSFYQMRPIIRPEVQRMLLEEFYPPLSTTSMPGNMGALRVPSDDIQKWAAHQRQQRGVKMLTIADALKNLSGGRLKRSSEVVAKSKKEE